MTPADSVSPSFVADVRQGLSATPKQLPPRYFYDSLGSALFDAICRLPWYRITRAELALLARHAPAIVHPLAGGRIVELGCGTGEKVDVLAAAARDAGISLDFHLVDVSSDALAQTGERLQARGFDAIAHQATFDDGLRHLPPRSGVDAPTLVLFLGSNIGNFEGTDAQQLLRSISVCLAAGDRLLLGTDLVKREEDLILAYDDPLGVTAAFNKNILLRMNRELGADFDLTRFVHRAVWRPSAHRIEMHLVSTEVQRVGIPAAGMTAVFAAGESIWTESSCKYEPDEIQRMGQSAGFELRDQWMDEEARFALTVFEKPPA